MSCWLHGEQDCRLLSIVNLTNKQLYLLLRTKLYVLSYKLYQL